MAYQLAPNAGHTHCANVAPNGNGASSTDAGHSHAIYGFNVQPAGNPPHSHAFTRQPCGAGGVQKPCNCGRK